MIAMIRHTLLLLGLLLAVGLGRADAMPAPAQVRVVDTWPQGDDIALGQSGHFYLRLAYRSDHPVGIWVQGYFHGKPAPVGTSPSIRYDGEGEALGWLFFLEPDAQVDEIRITAGDGSLDGTPVVATLPVRLSVGAAVAGDEAGKPAWVDELLAKQRDAQRTAAARNVAAPVSAGETMLFSGFMLLMFAIAIGGLALPAWACWRWRGGWRLAAAVPAALMMLVVGRIVSGVAVDPTSHNLWPFELLQAGVPAVLAIGVMALLRRVRGTRG
ncbi:MAG: hypothetical protein B7X39_16545 [Lysobacterales bacterium 14-68-21]|jgi:hypothetical protein|nr:MAG: hypothetical protein B7X45_14535 [Xanthomonadales bacterium 15-68-25]OZB64410.1 MAG: hypothetical protein B7X39_16545 [Xanthomonadales bacterium 14-68-21]